jgi:hypothetical protein
MKLEVLPAQKGDCLMLHSDTEDGPGLILIDGGPAGVAEDTLLPRLEALRDERGLGEGEPLVIDLVVVSHVDDDHINGIIDLFEAIKERRDARQPPMFKVKELWHNSFDRILGNDETGALLDSGAQFGAASTGEMDSLIEDAPEGAATDHAKILASVKQGDDLKRLAADLGIPVNGQFGGRLIRTAEGETVSRTVAGIEFVVVGPRQAELQQLQKEFDEWLKKQPFAERSPASLLSALDDESAANLSSIVLLARKDGKSILLTGDARSDKVLEGLADCGLCGPGGTLEVDVLKMPHHGSIRNLDDEGDFLGRVTSPNYVFSGNGEHSNPDRETFDLLFKTRPSAEITLYLTYTMAEIDPERHKIYDKERNKAVKKGRTVPEWSHATNALSAILTSPPAGTTVIEHDGSTMTIEP